MLPVHTVVDSLGDLRFPVKVVEEATKRVERRRSLLEEEVPSEAHRATAQSFPAVEEGAEPLTVRRAHSTPVPAQFHCRADRPPAGLRVPNRLRTGRRKKDK